MLIRASAAVGLIAGLCTIAAFVFEVWPFVPSPPDPDITGGTPSAFCEDADLSLSRGTGPSGTEVVVSGTGFLADAEVVLTFHTDTLIPANSDVDGNFSQPIRIPGTYDAFAPSNFTIRARAKACTATAVFTVTN